MSARIIPGVHKIAVLRASALGDFLFAIPALEALRRTYPEAEIVYLGKSWHQSFVPRHISAIDRVVVVPPCAGVGEAEDFANDTAQLDNFFEEMRRECFDIALQMHGGGRFSNAFINRLGAALTVGSRAPDAEPLDQNIPFSFYQNEVLRCLEIAGLVGAATSDYVPRLVVHEQDVSLARRFAGRRYAVIHPGASDPRRRWPAEHFGVVASHFCDQGWRVFVTGTSDEYDIVDAVVRSSGGRALGLQDLVDLSELTALLAGAGVVVSNDTGPLHLARAVGAPTVGLYWCGNYITAGPIVLHRHRSLLSWTINCPECGTPCVSSAPFAEGCMHQVSFIGDIAVDDVINEALFAANSVPKGVLRGDWS